MTKVLIVDGGTPFGSTKGALNHTLTEVAATELRNLGHEVTITLVDSEYVVADEVQKFVNSDVVIYQMAGWWMGPPWTMKRYVDEVFTAGQGSLYASDGRSRSDNTKKYGSGGLATSKKYMLSLTWNAPLEAFTDPNQFFEGVGVDGVYLHFHKANQFLGMKALPTFICNDVIKQTDVPTYTKEYQAHLAKLFGKQ